MGRIPRGAEWRGFGAGDGTGARGRWRGARDGQRSGAGDVDLGGAAGVAAWGRRRGREGKLGEARAVLLFALVGGAEEMCVGRVFCGRKTPSSFLGELKDLRLCRCADVADE